MGGVGAAQPCRRRVAATAQPHGDLPIRRNTPYLGLQKVLQLLAVLQVAARRAQTSRSAGLGERHSAAGHANATGHSAVCTDLSGELDHDVVDHLGLQVIQLLRGQGLHTAAAARVCVCVSSSAVAAAAAQPNTATTRSTTHTHIQGRGGRLLRGLGLWRRRRWDVLRPGVRGRGVCTSLSWSGTKPPRRTRPSTAVEITGHAWAPEPHTPTAASSARAVTKPNSMVLLFGALAKGVIG